MLRLMNDQLEFVKLIADRLDGAAIPYMLTGSVAMAHYAEPRMTRDVDLVVECPPDQSDRLISLFSGDCYVDDKTARDAIRSQGMFNIIHNTWAVKADFIIRKGQPYREAEFERRRSISVEGSKLWIVAPEDLILSKLVWSSSTGSDQQNSDVKSLLAAVPDLNWEHLNLWSDKLGVKPKLQELKPS